MISVLLLLLVACCALCDVRYRIIPNKIIYCLFFLGLIKFSDSRISITSQTVYIIILSILLLFFYKTRRLGAGDIKLIIVLAMFFRPYTCLILIYIAFISALVYFFIISAYKQSFNLYNRIPLAPFIFGATIIILIHER